MDWLNQNRRRRDHIRCIQIFVQLHIIDEAIQRSCFYQIVNQILHINFQDIKIFEGSTILQDGNS